MTTELPELDFQRFWRRLQQLGLNAYEARSYLVLIGHPRFKAIELAARAHVPRQKIYEVLDSLIVAVHIRDRYTLRHSEDVLIYSILMAQELGLDMGEIETLKLAAFLHDTGMIGVPERLLRRPGRDHRATLRYCAVRPPSITSSAPVTNADSSASR